MGRRATYSTEALVSAAVELFAGGGVRALTMTAVARAVGAPSGSVYHRFPDRPALLAAVWLYTVRDFQAGYWGALGPEPSVEAAIGAGEWMVDWCRENPAAAAVLQAGPHAFAPESWSAESAQTLKELQDKQTREIKSLVDRISTRTGLPRDQTRFALFDLPLAVVRPYLIAGKRPPQRSRAMVRDLTAAILGSGR
ncbi:MAG: TetR/AcrR family transcriptional regulator [Nocardia sp.]|nr:TetR/AcrR family transcriptional regulator [Nocardia sp.]